MMVTRQEMNGLGDRIKARRKRRHETAEEIRKEIKLVNEKYRELSNADIVYGTEMVTGQHKGDPKQVEMEMKMKAAAVHQKTRAKTIMAVAAISGVAIIFMTSGDKSDDN